MKFKGTIKGSVKIKMNLDDLTVITSILNHVLLGQGANSDVVLDFIDQASNFVDGSLKVKLSKDNGSERRGLAILV